MALLIHYLIETPFNTFANRAGPDQAALVRLYAYGNMIRYDHALGQEKKFLCSMYNSERLFI